MAYQLSNYKDIDSSVAPLVLQYYKYMDQEDYAGASSLLEENHELLKPYIIDMDSINKIEQGLHDLWQTASLTQSVVITEDQTEPEGDFGPGTEWFAEYEIRRHP